MSKQDKPIVQRVPCDGCVACCQSDRIAIKPHFGDDPRKYITEMFKGRLVVAHKKNGDCVYLDRENGCKIWDRRPAVCQEFDCRLIVQYIPESSLVRMISKAVIERGKQLLAQEDIRTSGCIVKQNQIRRVHERLRRI